MTEKEVLDLPTGVVSFYMDVVDPRTPGRSLLTALSKLFIHFYIFRFLVFQCSSIIVFLLQYVSAAFGLGYLDVCYEY